MSDWFEDLPPQWAVTRLKNVVEDVRTGVWGTDANGGPDDIACVRVADFDRPKMGLKEVTTLRSVPEGDRAGRLLKRGDILLEKSGGTDLNPVGFSVMFDGDYPAVSSNFIARLRVRAQHSARYWLYCLAASYATRRTERSVRRTTGIQNLDQNEFFNEQFPAPPLDEQRAIANYLDRETAQIDTLIAEQQRLIELLDERRSAAFRQAFPASPATALRRFVSSQRPLTYGILQCGEPYPDGVPYVGPSDMETDGRSPRLADLRRTSPEIAAQYSRSVLRSGDVVVSIGPAYGKIALLSDELSGANLTQDTVRVDCNRSTLDPNFLVRLLQSPQVADFWDMQITGATFRRLNLGTLGLTPVPILPLDEQRRIVAELDEVTSKIDTLIAEAERFIELSKERRSALITAAVTGQIEVPGVA